MVEIIYYHNRIIWQAIYHFLDKITNEFINLFWCIFSYFINYIF